MKKQENWKFTYKGIYNQMRKIKYKIYYRQSVKYNYACWKVTELKFTEDGVEAYIKEDDNPYYVGEDCWLVQFTGLLDRTGKEIYEGDILCATGELVNNRGESFPYDKNNVVEYKGSGFTGLDYGGSVEVEVIGNIYENSELLNKE